MNTRIITLLFTIMATASLLAQPCDMNSSGIRLASQTDVDNFSIRYQNCDVINGDLKIGADIENLLGLSQIKRINGNLLIRDAEFSNYRNEKLNSLEGLNNLEYVGGNVYIDSIENIKSFAGLSKLKTIGGQLFIANNSSLEYLDGMPMLDSLYGNLSIIGHPSLINLLGLNSITHFGSDIEIRNNSIISNLSGFENINSVSGSFIVRNNAELDSLKGLEKLNVIDGDFIIEDNQDLTVIGKLIDNYKMGPVLLSEIKGDLKINRNEVLGSMSGLNGLTTIRGNFEIKEDASLLHLDHLAGLVKCEGTLFVIDNPKTRDFHGLDQLNEIGGISIFNNTALISLYGLHNIKSVIGDFYIGGGQAELKIVSGGEKEDGTHRLLSVEYIEGSLDISGTDAILLLGFYNLQMIEGDLILSRNNTLVNLYDFRRLKTISGSFILDYNYELAEVQFDSLNYVGGLSITDNDKFSLCNLYTLETIGDMGLLVNGNTTLHYLYGLYELEEIQGDVKLYDTELRDFSGLENLERIGGYVWMDLNGGLFTFEGLENLQSIGGFLRIINSTSLIHIGALQNLKSIDGILEIGQNRFLGSLYGIHNIDYRTITGLDIFGNQSLSICEVESICSYLHDGATSNIAGNAMNCNSIQEVLNACALVSINELAIQEVLISPNPVSHRIRLAGDIKGISRYKVLNIMGQELDSGIVNNQLKEIAVHALTPGIYFLQLQSKGFQLTQKFVKE